MTERILDGKATLAAIESELIGQVRVVTRVVESVDATEQSFGG